MNQQLLRQKKKPCPVSPNPSSASPISNCGTRACTSTLSCRVSPDSWTSMPRWSSKCARIWRADCRTPTPDAAASPPRRPCALSSSCASRTGIIASCANASTTAIPCAALPTSTATVCPSTTPSTAPLTGSPRPPCKPSTKPWSRVPSNSAWKTASGCASTPRWWKLTSISPPMPPCCGTRCALSRGWSTNSIKNCPAGCAALPIAPVARAAACKRSSACRPPSGTRSKRPSTATYCDLGEKVIDQTRRRVLDGEQVPPDEKVYSIFESHTHLIKRGKQRQPVEFGHKVFLAESSQGLITDYQILDGNPADTTQVQASLDHHHQVFQHSPELYAGDRGFYSADNVDHCQEAGVSQVYIPQRGGQKTANWVA